MTPASTITKWPDEFKLGMASVICEVGGDRKWCGVNDLHFTDFQDRALGLIKRADAVEVWYKHYRECYWIGEGDGKEWLSYQNQNQKK